MTTNDPLANLEAANGQLENLAATRKLEELFCIKQLNPFGTNNLAIFQENLARMTYSDMQKMAGKVMINPYIGQAQLRDCLLKAFAADCKERQTMMPPPRKETPQLDPENPKHRKLMLQLGMFS